MSPGRDAFVEVSFDCGSEDEVDPEVSRLITRKPGFCVVDSIFLEVPKVRVKVKVEGPFHQL